MNILITGTAGFIGSHLAETFLSKGHLVIGIDNYISGQKRNTLHLSKFTNFQFMEKDVSNDIFSIPIPLDWIFHFASPASPPHYQNHQIETLMVGAQGCQHMLELAKNHKAKFMLASTSEVYGSPQVHPQSEDYWGHVNPNGLRSCYDEAKRYAEALTMAYYRTYNLDIRIIRIFNTYGPQMKADDGRVVTNFINQALQGKALTVYGTGSQTRSFQYITDLLEGILALMRITYHLPINLGNPDEYSILKFAQIVQSTINPNIPIEFKKVPEDDPPQRRPDISRAKSILSWSPQTSLSEGLKLTINYFKQLEHIL